MEKVGEFKLPIDLQLVAVIPTGDEIVLMMQSIKNDNVKPKTVIKISSNVESWLEPLKQALKDGSTLIYSQNEPLSGILGLHSQLH